MGGAPGAGKSTAAWLLAHRHDLRLYPVDARAYAHAARSRGPTMLRLNSLEPGERFGKAPDVLAQQFLDYSREQFELVLEDLAAYPESPPVVAEGPQLLPDLTGPQSVFLLPTPEFQRSGLFRRQPGRRSQVVERDALLAGAIREQAAQHGRNVVEVDGSLGPDAVVARLGELFVPVLDAPRPVPDLPAMRRHENELIAENLLAAGITTYPFACECGRSGCAERVELPAPGLADRGRIVAPAHAV